MFVEFCLPVYNEEKILKENVLKLFEFCQKKNFAFAWKLTIAVNGSSDRSAEIAEDLARAYPEKIKAMEIKEGGKGRAVKAGVAASQSDLLVYMDIDLAVSLENIPSLLEPLFKENYDLVIGSRLLPDSKTERPFLRSLSSRIYNQLSRLVLGHNLSDLQCGFKAVKTEIFKKFIPYIEDDNWFFDTELVAFARHFGYRIKEIPVNWSENRYEQRSSKIKVTKDSFIFLSDLADLKLRLFFKK